MSARVASRVISRAPARRTTPRFRVVRNVVQRVTRPVVKRAASSGFDISDCVEDISKTVSSSVGNPLFLLSSLAVFALVVTHQTAFTSGVIGKWAKDNSENVFAKWLLENSGKFLGLAVFLPSILTSPKKKQVVLGILVFLWVTLIPESSVYQYCIQSAAIHCYFRVKNSNTRLLLVIAIAIAYACGWLSVAGDLSPAPSQAAKATIPKPSSG